MCAKQAGMQAQKNRADLRLWTAACRPPAQARGRVTHVRQHAGSRQDGIMHPLRDAHLLPTRDIEEEHRCYVCSARNELPDRAFAE